MIVLIVLHAVMFMVLGWFTVGYLRNHRKLAETAQLLHLQKEHENYLKEQIRVLTGRLCKMAPFGKPVLERLLKEELRPITLHHLSTGRYARGETLEIDPAEIIAAGWIVPPHEYEVLRQHLKCGLRQQQSLEPRALDIGYDELMLNRKITVNGHPVLEGLEEPAKKEEYDQKGEEG